MPLTGGVPLGLLVIVLGLVAWLLLKQKTLGVALTIIGGLIVAATVVLVALALASPM